MNAHWLLAVGLMLIAVVVFLLGWNASIYWAEWQDDKALRAAEARHARRKGDPPRPTAVLADPPQEPPWHFAGESGQGWAAEAAEYELLHQPEPEHVPGVDTPSDFTRRMALDMDLFIKNMVEQSNYDQHMMRAD